MYLWTCYYYLVFCPSLALSLFFLDIFATDFWSTSKPVSHEVALLMGKLKFTALASRAPGTYLNYTRVFNRWRSFAADVLGIAAFPVEPLHCALFLQYLLDSSKSVSTINSAFYAFKWLHDLAGVCSPTSHPTVVAVKEGASRLVFSPVKYRKEPLEAEHLRKLMDRTDMNDRLQLRNFFELSLIRAKYIKFSEGFISIFIEKSKADQLREGQSVAIAESGSSLCPVALLKLYINSSQLSLDSDEFIFRPISASRNCKRLVSVNKPICYSTYRESFKKSFRGIVPDIAKFSTHSARSGGATSAANSGVPDRNFQRHGRWASVSAKNTYIKDSLARFQNHCHFSSSPFFLSLRWLRWPTRPYIIILVCPVGWWRQNM